ncbi:MAG: hypothetical protein PHR61_01385 [Candidatus Absconditabacteria bacterium]|nr:hypothetical protein [Candidatus Absconditabacteria bacterium]
MIGTKCSQENLANLILAGDGFSRIPTELIMKENGHIILFNPKPFKDAKDAELEIQSVETNVAFLIDIKNGNIYIYKGPDPDEDLIKRICLMCMRFQTFFNNIIDVRDSVKTSSLESILYNASTN